MFKDEYQAMSVSFYVHGHDPQQRTAHFRGDAGSRVMPGSTWEDRAALSVKLLSEVREHLNERQWRMLQLKFGVLPADVSAAVAFVSTELDRQLSFKYPAEFLQSAALAWGSDSSLSINTLMQTTGLSERTLYYWKRTVFETLKGWLCDAMAPVSEYLVNSELIND